MERNLKLTSDAASPEPGKRRYLRAGEERGRRGLIGVGGIGYGMLFALDGDRTLGRSESRPGRLLDSRDYCKLHIIAHYVAVLMGASQGSGFHVLPVGKVGRDAPGLKLVEEMARAGMDTRSVGTAEGRPTTMSVCFQYPDGSGGNITASDSASTAVISEDVDRAAAFLLPPPGGYVALAAPEAPLETRFHLMRSARRWGSYTVASFASSEIESALAGGGIECVDLVALNHDELEAIIGRSADAGAPGAALDRCSGILAGFQPEIRIVVTMGAHGAFAFDRGSWHHCPALPVTPVSTAGAGDALLGGVISALAAGVPLSVDGPQRRFIGERPIESALEFGVLLSGLKITSRHTIHPDANTDSLLEFAANHGVSLAGTLADAIVPSNLTGTPSTKNMS